MRVDQAFQKAGFELVHAKRDKERGLLTMDVRIPLQSPKVPTRWKQVLDQMLTAQEAYAERGNATWDIDISKRFFSKRGVVRYLWRIAMSGNLEECQLMLAQATLASLRVGNEITEVLLIGQENLTPDLANGKIRGAYHRGEDDRASGVVAQALHTGGVNYRNMPSKDEGLL